MTGRTRSSDREWGGRLPLALVFPEEESQGLATLGWQSVFKELDADNGFYVERFFLDREHKKAVPPGTDRPLSLFPLWCFSLNFEGDYLYLINIIQAENIPLHTRERSDWPLIMAGGPVASLNPFPIVPSLDFLFVGESEGVFRKIALAVRSAWLSGWSRSETLEEVSGFPGVLVPGRKQRVQRQVFMGSGRYLPRPVHSAFVSSRSVFRDSFLVEINRGCPYGCRFCAAGFIYRPPRQARLADLQDLIRAAQPQKVGLVGTALTDWADLKPFLAWLHSRKIKFSLSSMRADGLDRDFLVFLRHSGTRTITLAVEGVSRSLRAAMNKNFDQESFFSVVQLVSELRFNTLKLYFILGLPGENLEDFEELSYFLAGLDKARKKGMGRRNRGLDLVSISVSMFVPKPWTPLQWAPMDSEESYLKKVDVFRKICAGYKGLRFQAEKPFAARVQGLLSRGDEKVHDLLVLACEQGNSWKKALKLWSGKMEDYIDREYSLDTRFVWDIIDVGMDKNYLIEEWEKYKAKVSTRPCPGPPCSGCRRCGMAEFIDDRR